MVAITINLNISSHGIGISMWIYLCGIKLMTAGYTIGIVGDVGECSTG